ncbi:MAG: HEAT repeat domain-containing protein [Nostocaceae cyanobacterium]|nr:HEAT repeat domain-containing protein [Nostocaceae cyanobacterium]
MNNNSHQPREFDAVLGGETSPPVTGVVLGGIEGVKRRLENENEKVRIAALYDAFNYGDEGLDLLIEALEDDSQRVKRNVVRLLKERGGEKGKQELLEYNPYLYFTKLDNWEVEHFNPEVGITNPVDKAYIVNLEQLTLLLQDKRANDIEVLIYYLNNYYYEYAVSQEFYDFVDILFKNRKILNNLKALFIGDVEINKFRKSRLGIGDISLLIEGYPNLELLHIRGYCQDLDCSGVSRHNNLKTLIIETADISDIEVDIICSLNLPALEYFELWIGRNRHYVGNSNNLINNLKPILFSESFPNLKYLGIRSSEHADEIADAIAESSFIAESPIIDNLSVLDLSMGNLTDEGLKILLEFPAIRNLHTLDISHNCVTEDFLEEVEQLSLPDCLLIADSQEEIADRGVGASRYCALHE